MKNVSISDVTKISSGFAFQSNFFTDDAKQMPLIRIRDVSDGYTTTYYSGEYSKEYVIKRGDLLITMDGEFRISKWNAGDALLNQRVCKIESTSNALLNEYLYYLLPKKLKDIENKTPFVTVKHLSVKTINEIKLRIPAVADQQRIVKLLDGANTLRQKRKRAVELLDDYLKSVFWEMFGDPVKNPRGWKEKEVSELCLVKIGPFGSLLHKEDYVSGGIPLINPKHMINGKIIVDPENCISKEKHQQLKDYHLKTNDLIMARRGEIGRCAVITEREDNFLCGTGSILLRPTTPNVSNMFLFYLFSTESMIKIFEKGANGVTMQNLNAGTIKKIRIIVPSAALQNKFASVVRHTECLKQKMLAQSEELENQFQALMQKAFDGVL